MKNIEIKPKALVNKQEIIEKLNELLAPYSNQKPRHDPDLTQLMPGIKRAIAEAVLEHTYGNLSKAARLLGINRFTLRRLYNGKS